jgi:hypothetical protein
VTVINILAAVRFRLCQFHIGSLDWGLCSSSSHFVGGGGGGERQGGAVGYTIAMD